MPQTCALSSSKLAILFSVAACQFQDEWLRVDDTALTGESSDDAAEARSSV